MVKVIRSANELEQSVGQVVQKQGLSQRMKAGSSISFNGVEIWCSNVDWDHSSKEVRVTGRLSQGISPMRSFPVATQDESGAWSQGVGEYKPLNPEPTAVTTNASDSNQEQPKTAGAWLLEVQDHIWID